jgi:capsular polysaccharide biosynthesis protein
MLSHPDVTARITPLGRLALTGAMNLRDFSKRLRTRWFIVFWTTVAAVSVAIAITLLTTPLYEASTRLFVSTATDTTSDLYKGSQERVHTYTKLLTGRTLAQRTVDRLHLDTSAEDLQGRVFASAESDTVLIDVDVLDESPSRARDIANGLSDEFVKMVRELETPLDADLPNARVLVQERASLPKEPTIPHRTRNIEVGLAVGLLLGIALAVLRGWRDKRFKNREVLD